MKTAPKKEVHFIILHKEVRTRAWKKRTKHDKMGSVDLIWTSVSVYTEKNMNSFCIYFVLYLSYFGYFSPQIWHIFIILVNTQM